MAGRIDSVNSGQTIRKYHHWDYTRLSNKINIQSKDIRSHISSKGNKVLYIIYTSEYQWQTEHMEAYIYADDMTKAATSEKADKATTYYEQEIEKMEKCANKWSNGINAEKTQAILVSSITI